MAYINDFGAAGDGQSDDTDAFEHAIVDGDGCIRLFQGVYRITRTIEVPLNRQGPLSFIGDGRTCEILMTGPGPALRLVGSHGGTADPADQKEIVRRMERGPIISQVTITGEHPEADGIELVGTMQANISQVLLHRLRHGIRLFERNRNVVIENCQIYFNTGVGVFLDQVNLHQINIIGNHISYNRLGGVRIEGSEVRNLQITGNDIEYNNFRAHQTEPTPTAEIYIDTSVEGASVNEVAICSNTIQATASPGGANIRIVDAGEDRRPGQWTITGNVIGSQENNVHLTCCYGVIISGNSIYSGANRNVLLESCRQVVLSGNHSHRHDEGFFAGWRIVDSSDCTLTGNIIHDEISGGQSTGASLLEIVRGKRINVTGCQFLDGVPFGIDVEESKGVSIVLNTIATSRAPGEGQVPGGAIRFRGVGQGNQCRGNAIRGNNEMAGESGVLDESNVVLEFDE